MTTHFLNGLRSELTHDRSYLRKTCLLLIVILSQVPTLFGQREFPPATEEPPPGTWTGKLFPKVENSLEAEFSKGTILLISRPGNAVQQMANEKALDALHQRLGTKIKARFRGTKTIDVIELPPQANVSTAVWQFAQSGFVETAEPDIIVRKTAVPNDPYFVYDSSRRLDWHNNVPGGDDFEEDAYQWSLQNTGQTPSMWKNGTLQVTYPANSGADIKALAGWQTLSNAPNQIIAILDDGVRVTHEDLAGNLWVNQAEFAGQPGVDDDHNGIIDDIHGIDSDNTGNVSPNPLAYDENHGTFVAGLIGAKHHNSKGIDGVANQVQIMPLRLTAFTISKMLPLINYAISRGAHFINISLRLVPIVKLQ